MYTGGTETVAGWSFDIEVTGGTPSVSTLVTTDDFEDAFFTVEIPGSGATLRLTEEARADTLFLEASCVRFGGVFEEAVPVATGQDGSITFDVEPAKSYGCTFINRPADLPSTQVQIQKWMTESRDPDARDVRAGAGWPFTVEVAGGTASQSRVETRANGIATVDVEVAAETARVTISEPTTGPSEIASMDCWDALGEDEIDFEVDGAAITFDVAPAGGYICQFFNVGELPAPLPTPPATDSFRSTSSSTVVPFWLAVAGIVGLAACLVRGPRRPGTSR